jgi:hypothetical protein
MKRKGLKIKLERCLAVGVLDGLSGLDGTERLRKQSLRIKEKVG